MAKGNRVNHHGIHPFKVLLIKSMIRAGYTHNTIADTVHVSLPSVVKYSKGVKK